MPFSDRNKRIRLLVCLIFLFAFAAGVALLIGPVNDRQSPSFSEREDVQAGNTDPSARLEFDWPIPPGASYVCVNGVIFSFSGFSSGSPLPGLLRSAGEYSQQLRVVEEGSEESLSDYPYLIEMADGTTVAGRSDTGGLTVRVYTDEPAEMTVYWGEEAVQRFNGIYPQTDDLQEGGTPRFRTH